MTGTRAEELITDDKGNVIGVKASKGNHALNPLLINRLWKILAWDAKPPHIRLRSTEVCCRETLQGRFEYKVILC